MKLGGETMSIGSRIKEKRIEKGLTRKELATIIGVTPSAVANYENGVSVPKIEIMSELIKELGCDANYIYQDETISENESFTYDEQLMIKKYRQLNSDGKEMVDMILNREFQFLEYRRKMERIRDDK